MDVNIMSTSVYRLVFKDPELKKLAPSSLKIGTYTTDILKIVRSCTVKWSTQTVRITGSYILFWLKWWSVTFILYNYTCAWSYTTQNKIGLFTSKDQLDYKLSRPSKEDKSSKVVCSLVKTRCGHSKHTTSIYSVNSPSEKTRCS